MDINLGFIAVICLSPNWHTSIDRKISSRYPQVLNAGMSTGMTLDLKELFLLKLEQKQF